MALKLNGDNSVSTPGFTGTDTDTGLQCGTDELKLVTGGEEQVKVDSGGRVLFEKAVRFQYNTDSTDSRTWMLSNDVHSAGDFAFRRSDAQTSTSFDTKILFKESGGICFNGDTAAVNALDDYEEGTFTPTFTNGTFTYDTQAGNYTKIGNTVNITGMIKWTAKSGTGQANITVPFTCGANRAAGCAGWSQGVNLGSTDRPLVYTMSSGEAVLKPYILNDNTSPNAVDVGGFSASGEVQFAITYEVQ